MDSEKILEKSEEKPKDHSTGKPAESQSKDDRDFLLEYLDNRIRTTLNSLQGLVRDGREENFRSAASGKVDQIFARISLLGRELKDSTAGIMDLYLRNVEKSVRETENVELDHLIEGLLAGMRQECQDRHVILRNYLAELSGTPVRIDRKQAFSLMNSLLQVAVRYSNPNSTVTMQGKRLGREDGKIQFEFSAELTDSALTQDHFVEMKTLYRMIRQRGIGIMPVGLDDRSVSLLRLFFYAEAMGIPNVAYRMTAGGISLSFPCEMEEGRREKNLASWGNMSDLAGKWILLAEDNRINQEVISRILTSYGMCVILAGDGQETLKIYQENEDRIDLILMDVVMLNMNGLEATRQIRSLPSEKAKTVPVIAITADTLRRSLSTELRESGINAYLYKPLEPEVLIQEIRTFI